MIRKHRVTVEQAVQVLAHIAESTGVMVWHAPGYPTADDEGPCWYTPIGLDDPPDPQADSVPTALLNMDDFEVVEFQEVFRKTLPASARPGIKLSEELIEAYTAEFEKAHDTAGLQYDEAGSQFAIEPNKERPWLYDGVVYAVRDVVPLREWSRKHGAA